MYVFYCAKLVFFLYWMIANQPVSLFWVVCCHGNGEWFSKVKYFTFHLADWFFCQIEKLWTLPFGFCLNVCVCARACRHEHSSEDFPLKWMWLECWKSQRWRSSVSVFTQSLLTARTPWTKHPFQMINTRYRSSLTDISWKKKKRKIFHRRVHTGLLHVYMCINENTTNCSHTALFCTFTLPQSRSFSHSHIHPQTNGSQLPCKGLPGLLEAM